jgi:inner membrane protein
MASLAAQRGQVRHAVAAGIAGALVPDLDVLLFATDADPLREIEFHRHFTHALAFVPVGGLLAAALVWLLLRRRAPFPALWLFAALGTATAGLLDACTGFGTHLFWPFSQDRNAWGIIAIVDPVFTLALACGVMLAVKRRSRIPATCALVFAGSYLLLGLWQKERATEAMRAAAARAGETIERSEVRPTIGNLLLWRCIYETNGEFHALAVRAGLGSPRVYAGGTIPRAHSAALITAGYSNTVQGRDIERFARFSDGYLVVHPERPDVVGDIRFSMLPQGTTPLWGIALDAGRRDEHVRFLNFRRADAPTRATFWAMLRGADLPPR